MGKNNKSGSKSKKPTILAVPNKSPADPLEYRSLLLPNGLKVLLISDPTADMGLSDDEDMSEHESDNESGGDDEDMSENDEGEHADDDIGLRNAAAALCVGAGGFHEPKDAPGLAHFLEHMVFMGSKKYPDENKFDEFLSARNGWSNAYTDAEVTLFYFEVKPSSLEEALDMWSRFYIDPLMKTDSVNREVQAVDSEFQIAQTRDANRISGIMTYLAENANTDNSKNHPAGKFTWGNILSLKGTKDIETDVPKLHENLTNLHAKYYAAKAMSLAVQSPHDLDELQKFVVKRFGAIPNPETFVEPDSTIEEFKNDTDIWKAVYNDMIEVRPIGDKIKLQIQWQLKGLIHEWESDPLHYISWLTGHEGKGSIFDHLQSEGLATEVSSGTGGYGDDSNRLYTLFKTEITLTDKGYSELERVLNTVHSYMAMMRESGALESVWNMVAKIDKINWDTKDLDEPSDNVVQCTEQMMKYPVEHWLDAEDLPFKFNPELIKEILDQMTPARSVNIMLHPDFRKEEESNFPETDAWFGVKWRKCATFDYKFTKVDKELLHYPGENPYLTDDLALVTIESEKSEIPVVLVSDEKSRLHFMPDFEFKLPKSFIKVLYRCDDFLHQENANRQALLSLVPTFMMLNLSSELYDATTASLSYAIDIKNNGFTIDAKGISATAPKLLKRLVRALSESESWPETNFEMAKNEVKTSFQDKILNAGNVGNDIRTKWLEQGSVTLPQQLKAMDSDECNFENMKKCVKEMLENSSLDMLYQGNARAEDAKELFSEVLKLNPVGGNRLGKDGEKTGINVRKLVKNETMHVNSFNTRTSDNHYATKYYQWRPSSAREAVLIELFCDIISESTFNELRTKRQLGYVAFSSIKNSWGTLGWSVNVKSSIENHKMEYIQTCIDEYTEKYVPEEVLAKLTENEFKTYTSSLIVGKTAKDATLKDVAKRNYGEIESQDLMFDRLEKEVEWLEKLKFEEFIEFIKTMISECRIMEVQVWGNSIGEEMDLTSFDWRESSTIKSTNGEGFEVYPVSQTIDK